MLNKYYSLGDILSESFLFLFFQPPLNNLWKKFQPTLLFPPLPQLYSVLESNIASIEFKNNN